MKKRIKLGILILLSTSVFFIYQKTKNTTYTILNIGDSLSLGINSYGIRDYSYADYLKDYYETKKEKVVVNNTYATKDQSISNLLFTVKEIPSIKKDLSSADLLILTVGYNDLIYHQATEEKPSTYYQEMKKTYEDLIKEIKKYYHNSILVVGYFNPPEKDMEKKIGIEKLNHILNSSKEITYIDTTSLLKDREKYFSNPKSYYPNRYGYYVISKKIIRKTLANQ